MKKHLALGGIVMLLAACSHEGSSPSAKSDWGTGLNTIERKYGKPASETYDAVISSLESLELKIDRNRHDEHIRAFCLTRTTPLDWDKFADWVEMMISLHGANLLRIKGVLNVAEAAGPIAIHGVQHLFHPPVELPAWPDADRSSRLVFITRDIDGDTMSRSLTAFLGEDSAPA